MGQFRDALDKQFPPKTDIDRANYLALRELEKNAPTPRWALMLAGMLLLAIPVVFIVSSVNASPLPSAAGAAAQRNSDQCAQTKSLYCSNWSVAGGTWQDGPCKGRTHFECTPVPAPKDR